ncbi:MAG TPA: HNH endonuclease signature motif containing protein [Solirubrobacteraceae bacterium]|jgi:5-methylcytosine-specific restriction protein A|nr:HNH endonuclease signature motif containing protein [Solirubrobacteraceae bacterium]
MMQIVAGTGRTKDSVRAAGSVGYVFELGKLYVRRELHARFRGQEQGGIITPAGYPFILLITGEAGIAYGYRDEARADGSFLYYGEGQVGPMEFVRGNRAVRDHALEGRDLHLFEKVRSGQLRYVGQFVCASYQLVEDVPDANGEPRQAIAFELAPFAEDQPDEDLAAADIADLSLEQLREAALEKPTANAEPVQTKRTAYRRSAAVRAYTLARAKGICEGCDSPAPFLTAAGRPYLEPHHTRRISDGGPDHPSAVIALCPTCHTRAHYAHDGVELNHALIAHLREIEGPIRGAGRRR